MPQRRLSDGMGLAASVALPLVSRAEVAGRTTLKKAEHTKLGAAGPPAPGAASNVAYDNRRRVGHSGQ